MEMIGENPSATSVCRPQRNSCLNTVISASIRNLLDKVSRKPVRQEQKVPVSKTRANWCWERVNALAPHSDVPLCQLSRESISVSLRLAAQHRERRAQNRDGRGEEKDEEDSAKQRNRWRAGGEQIWQRNTRGRMFRANLGSSLTHAGYAHLLQLLCRLKEFIYLSSISHLVTRQAWGYEN